MTWTDLSFKTQMPFYSYDLEWIGVVRLELTWGGWLGYQIEDGGQGED